MSRILLTGQSNADVTILLAHGAGAPMDSPAMNAIAAALSTNGTRVARFEFDYMVGRRTSDSRRPPPRAETLISEYQVAVAELNPHGKLVIGGKSMGGRVASMLADKLYEASQISGLLCLGYPFHPIGKPDQLRTAHLTDIRTPTLIVQGTRDQFGTREEVGSYKLSEAIQILWLEDGDHDLRPRKAVSGLTAANHLQTLSDRVAGWIATLR